MKTSTKDQIEGKLHDVVGTVKELAGHTVGNPDLEGKGKAEKVGGRVQKKVGEVEQVFEK